MTKRDGRYEFIRIISMLLMVSAHTFAAIPRNAEADTLAVTGISSLFYLCNGLFFMLSGKFAFSSRCERPADYGRYYMKRFSSIGIPALVFMLLRTMHNAGWWPAYLVSPELWKDYIRNVLGDFRSCEYWFLYLLVGILTVAPFLSKIFQKASTEELLIFLGIGITYNALQVYVPGFLWDYPLGGWMVLFVLGYALEKIVVTPRQENYVILFGFGCLCLTVLQKRLGNAPGANDLAPAYAGMASGLFLLLKRVYRPGKRMDALVTALGKQSLSVYMLHMLFLPHILSAIPVENLWLRLSVVVLLTTAVSAVAAWLLNGTVIALLQWIFRKLMDLLGILIGNMSRKKKSVES